LKQQKSRFQLLSRSWRNLFLAFLVFFVVSSLGVEGFICLFLVQSFGVLAI